MEKNGEIQVKRAKPLPNVRRGLRKLCFIVILLLFRMFREVPRSTAFFVASRFASFYYRLGGKLCKITRKNLDRAFPGLDAAERERIAGGVFLNITRITVDFMFYEHYPKKYSPEFLDTAEAEEKIRKVLAQGKGAIIMTAHVGPWEFLVSYLSRTFGTHVIYRRLHFSPLADMIEAWRKRHGFIGINSTDVKRMFEVLENNEPLCLLPDLYLPRLTGVYTDFFGHPAYMSHGPTIFHLATKAPVIPVFIENNGAGYFVHALEPLEYTPTGDEELDYIEFTKIWTKALEDEIRRVPEQWPWFNERWENDKTD